MCHLKNIIILWHLFKEGKSVSMEVLESVHVYRSIGMNLFTFLGYHVWKLDLVVGGHILT